MLTARSMTAKQREELLTALERRFVRNMSRHKNLQWDKIEVLLKAKPEGLWSLNEMETTGGEPDVVGYAKRSGEYIFYDCSVESPKGRRSVCYDREALESRKEHKPESENSVAPSFVIAATKLFSCITTVRNRIMPPGRFVAR